MPAKAASSGARTSPRRPPLVTCYEGTDVTVIGPVRGDSIFVKLRGRSYDAVIAMYHDQGHAPVKLLGFDGDPRSATSVP